MTAFRFLGFALTGSLAVALTACGGHAGGGGDDDDDDVVLPACEAGPTTTFTFEKIATWKDDTKGAYSMIHDDFCGADLHGIQEQAVPALVAAHLRAGVGAIAGECEDNDNWGVLADVEQQGMEVVNHSFTHVNITTGNAPHEVVEAKAALDAHIQHPVSFFIFPYDYFTPQTIAAVGAAGHQGARAGSRDDNDGFMMPPLNGVDPVKDLEIEFDVWPRSYSKYALFFPDDTLTVHAYNAMEKGGWAMREFHSVMADNWNEAEQGFGPIKRSAYDKHLTFLHDAWQKGVLWTDNPSTILRYRHARAACKASVAGDVIKFDTSSADCLKYATPISVIVTTADDVPRVDGTQGGVDVETRKLGPRRFSINADPSKGDVQLSTCGNQGREVKPDTQIAPRPTPAASVCQIETVAGTGSSGKMDDLERPVEEFQVLPNPRQADGRTGTWSWYPQEAQVGIAADGANHVLHYAGSGLARWSGATLAFLGGNGAGSCYDGSHYQGIRFRIKGTVTSSDDLNGKVVISLVTAETQSRLYGGDLDGEGGHFNKVVPITSSWQTVSIPWAELNRPTWGATATLTAPAKTKLQAIDWGVSSMTSSFSIDIDDVELY